MKTIICTLLLGSLLLGCTPKVYQSNSRSDQAPNEQHQYADKLEPGSKLRFSSLVSTSEQTTGGLFIQKTYFPETRQMTHFTTYRSLEDLISNQSNGPIKEWWDNGDPRFEGQMLNGKRHGQWKDYYENGSSAGQYLNGELEGRWVSVDSLGSKRSETTYSEGKRQGPFKVWDKTGELSREGAYENDEIEWEKVYREDAPDGEIYKTVEENPQFPGCAGVAKADQKQCSDEQMLRFIYSNIKYPAYARENGIEGMAILNFVVEKDGSVTSVETKRGICRAIQLECERVVKLMPAWVPGKQDGEPVRVLFTLPVRFKLE